MIRFLTLIVLGVAALCFAAPVEKNDKTKPPLLVSEDFEKGADRWKPTDAKAWRVVETDAGKVYEQWKTMSDYKPLHRSPHNISLIKDVVVGDFVLTARVKNTAYKAGAHRDVCLFFGYQDPSHFYYAHLGLRPDQNSSQITIVDGAPRRPITKNRKSGIPWDDQWHNVKLVRRTSDGTIELYFDDMTKPKMAARDKRFTCGQLGIGSFDDTAQWDDVKVYGNRVERPNPTAKKQ